MAKDQRVERLRSIPLFASCSDEQLRFIATRVDEIEVRSGETLITEGTSGGEMFIVLTGEAEVRRGGKLVAIMKPGDHFGEIAVLDRGPRTATVVARTPMKCLVLSRSQFADVLHEDTEIAVALLHSVVSRLRAAAEALQPPSA